VIIDVERIGDARRREKERTGSGDGQRRATLDIGRGDRAAAIREEAELDDVLRAGRLAIEAHVALVLAPLHAALRAIGPLAVHQAQIAICALCMIFFHPEKGKPGENTEECPERAQNAAPKTRNEAIGK